MSSIRDAPSAESAARKNMRGALGIIAFLVTFAAAWYVAREVFYMYAPSNAQIDAVLHDALVAKVAEMKRNLPQVLDDATTLRDVKVDGLMVVYVHEINSGYQIQDVKALQDVVTRNACASPMRAALADGDSYRYEYWSAGTDSKLLGAFDITSCP